MRKRILFLTANQAQKPTSRNTPKLVSRLGKKYECTVLYREPSSARTFLKFLRAAVSPKHDVIVVVDLGVTNVYPAVIARLFGKKVITNQGEMTYESARLRRNWLRCQEIRFTEWLAQCSANAILVRGSYHKKLLQDAGYRNVHYFPDGVDVSAYKRIKHAALKQFKKKHGLDNALVLCEMAHANRSPELKTEGGRALIEAMRILKEQKVSGVKGLQIGGGDNWENLKRDAQNYGVAKDIAFLGRLPYEQLPLALSAADVCIHLLLSGIVFETRTTQKLPEYMAAGKYVVSPNIGEARRLVPLCGRAFNVRGFNDPQYWRLIAGEVKRLLKNKRELAQKQRAAQRIAEKEFDFNVLAARLDKIFQGLF